MVKHCTAHRHCSALPATARQSNSIFVSHLGWLKLRHWTKALSLNCCFLVFILPLCLPNVCQALFQDSWFYCGDFKSLSLPHTKKCCIIHVGGFKHSSCQLIPKQLSLLVTSCPSVISYKGIPDKKSLCEARRSKEANCGVFWYTGCGFHTLFLPINSWAASLPKKITFLFFRANPL